MLTQRVHLGVQDRLRDQRDSHVAAWGPKYILHSYADGLGLWILSSSCGGHETALLTGRCCRDSYKHLPHFISSGYGYERHGIKLYILELCPSPLPTRL